MNDNEIVIAESAAKDLAYVISELITDDAVQLYVDRDWYFEKVLQYMRAESEKI